MEVVILSIPKHKEMYLPFLQLLSDGHPYTLGEIVNQLAEKFGITDAGKVLGKTGDEGIDGVVREDKLGFSLIYIQAKRWDIANSVGRPEIQKFVGALAGVGAAKRLFITTAHRPKPSSR
jgi:restriction system protein